LLQKWYAFSHFSYHYSLKLSLASSDETLSRQALCSSA
jgi:hypothetical protein